MKRIFLFLLAPVIWGVGCSQRENININAYEYQIVKHGTFQHAAVATAHPLASEVGKYILEQGGTAVDAAIAINYALAVVYPNAGNIGGGGFMVIHTKHGDSHTIDFREKAPQLAHRDMFVDSLGNVDLSDGQIGHMASGVPGSVAGMELVHRKYGTLPFDQLIQPAVDLAEKGFSITEQEADGLNRMREDFAKYNSIKPVFVKDSLWVEKDTLIQEDLANTLKRIQQDGAKGFYEGETAKLIVEEMERGGGLISYEDLKAYEAVERDPIIFDYKEYQVISMGLPSSGGIVLGQMMEMVRPFPMRDYGFQTKESMNLMVEAERRAYADRAEYLGDIDFVEVPIRELLDTGYLRSRMSDFVLLEASVSEEINAGNVYDEKEETTHFSVIDSDGNMVSLTTTINSSYGSRVVIGNAGFLMNNGMDNFSAKPGHPNRFGLLGTEANAIAPGKRMLSSMTPTIVTKDSQPYMVLGTPGGSTIITSVFQTLMNVMEFGMSAYDAVNAPKFHHQWHPDLVYVERGFDEVARRDLDAIGYQIAERGAVGRSDVLLIQDGVIEAVGDNRGNDSVAGY